MNRKDWGQTGPGQLGKGEEEHAEHWGQAREAHVRGGRTGPMSIETSTKVAKVHGSQERGS